MVMDLTELDFSNPATTLDLLQVLVDVYGMTIAEFRRLHHLPNSTNLTIAGHRAYARKLSRSATGRFSGDDKNVGTARRLAMCLDGLQGGLDWDSAIALSRFAPTVTSPPEVERALIRRMLLRIPIDRAQRAFYKAVLEDPAREFEQRELQDKLTFGPREFNGALSALSKRINETPGLTVLRPGYRFVFEVIGEGHDRTFRAKPALLDELRSLPDLIEALALPWDTLLHGDAFVAEPPDTLFDRCVYTTVAATTVAAAMPTGRLQFEEGKPWTGAKEWLDDARAAGQRLAVVIGDSAEYATLLAWGVAKEIAITDGRTRVTLTELRPLTGHERHEFIVVSKQKPIHENHQRPYVLCYTPSFLSDESAAQVARPESEQTGDTSQTPASNRVGSLPSNDIESDAIAYELVQRRLRRHQSEFRDVLIAAYGGRCAISGTSVPEVLEAAHIEPHVENGDNRPENGLLLRCDLHALLDEGLLRIHPTTLEIEVSSRVQDPTYRCLHGMRLRARADGRQPCSIALAARWTLQRC